MFADWDRGSRIGQPDPAAVAALARPSWPLVAMITMVAASTMTALADGQSEADWSLRLGGRLGGTCGRAAARAVTVRDGRRR